MSVTIEDIGPAEAEAILAGGLSQLYSQWAVLEKTVEWQAQQMTEGKWCLTADPISITESGHLLNGRHRLLAIIRSGVTIRAVVERGVSDESPPASPTNQNQ